VERLTFQLESAEAPGPARPPVLVGVVSSGNLEVLLEPGGTPRLCRVEVATTAQGFGDVWEALLQDFTARHAVAGLVLSVNDGGATPAVVALRLAQALEEYLASP
jgi:malonate decarboxylase delta subunit